VQSLPSPLDTPRQLTQRRCLILWGNSLPPWGADTNAYDVIYYRSEYERARIEEVAVHHNLQHAYGVHLPDTLWSFPLNTTYDEESNIAGPSRLLIGAPSDACFDGSVTALHFPNSYISSTTSNCANGQSPLFMGMADVVHLTQLLRYSKEITFSISGLKEWMLVATAVACKGRMNPPKLYITSQNDRLISLATMWPADWDREYYSRQLVAA